MLGTDDVSNVSAVEKPLRGKNGDVVEATTGHHILDLFNDLVRGIDDSKLFKQMKLILDSSSLNDIIDLFVLAFQTRDCRGGKGERELFYTMFLILNKSYPDVCVKLLPFIPMFGYVKDLTNLVEEMCCLHVNTFQNAIISLLSKQLVDDYEKFVIEGVDAKVSLTAKWIPKENSSFSKRYKKFFEKLVKTVNLDVKARGLEIVGCRLKVYRLLTSTLCRHLDVLEIKMCSNHYSKIDFAKVPSIALNKWRKALLNEKVDVSPIGTENITGNRYPDRLDRVEARTKLRATVREGKIKGEQVFPHTIVNSFSDRTGGLSQLSVAEKEVLEGQWSDLVNKAKMDKCRTIIPMADVSGSMYSGFSDVSPIDVSISLSILLSEITHPAFRDRILTFSRTPEWINTSDCNTLESKVKHILSYNKDHSTTDLESAFRLILKVAVVNGLSSDEIPDLCIFSDMQFNSACGSVVSTISVYETMKLAYEEHGLKMPRVIFWNLNTSDVGYPTGGDVPNTVILSGYSQSLLKYIMSGVDIVEMTPYMILRDILDSDRYQCIRDVLTENLTEISKIEAHEIVSGLRVNTRELNKKTRIDIKNVNNDDSEPSEVADTISTLDDDFW